MKKISEAFSSTLYLALGLLIAFTIIPFLALFGMLDQLRKGESLAGSVIVKGCSVCDGRDPRCTAHGPIKRSIERSLKR